MMHTYLYVLKYPNGKDEQNVVKATNMEQATKEVTEIIASGCWESDIIYSITRLASWEVEILEATNGQ